MLFVVMRKVVGAAGKADAKRRARGLPCSCSPSRDVWLLSSLRETHCRSRGGIAFFILIPRCNPGGAACGSRPGSGTGLQRLTGSAQAAGAKVVATNCFLTRSRVMLFTASDSSISPRKDFAGRRRRAARGMMTSAPLSASAISFSSPPSPSMKSKSRFVHRRKRLARRTYCRGRGL